MDATKRPSKTKSPLTTEKSLTYEDNSLIDKTKAKFKQLPDYFYQRHNPNCLDYQYLLFFSLSKSDTG